MPYVPTYRGIPGDLAQKLQHESRMFRAQRNFYLTGFCLVLLIVIGRTAACHDWSMVSDWLLSLLA